MTTHAHTHVRTIQRRFGLTTRVTYSCQGCPFTVTDTGDEAKRQWLRHALSVEKNQRAAVGGEVG